MRKTRLPFGARSETERQRPLTWLDRWWQAKRSPAHPTPRRADRPDTAEDRWWEGFWWGWFWGSWK